MNKSWNKLKLAIEKQRFSKNIFWKVAILGKDLTWKLHSSISPYTSSFYYRFKNRKLFKNIKTYCMFVGNGRSGSTLVGSLLDAHQNIVIANELDIFHYIDLRYRRNLLFSILLEQSKYFSKNGKKGSGGYVYDVSNQWQGKFKTIKIIGNKKISRNTKRLHSNPELLDKLRSIINLKIKFIHIMKNPYDAITTRASKSNKALKKVTTSHIKKTIDEYFLNVETVSKLKKNWVLVI